MQKLDREQKSSRKFKKINQLNNLSGKDWIKFTKSWFKLGVPARDKKIFHPASFPETLATNFISFFTKRNQWVIDPFLGTGSSLVAAKMLDRNGLGLELYQKYAELAEKRLMGVTETNARAIVRRADARDLARILEEEGIEEIDFCITSPPYWNQLNRNNKRQKKRKIMGLDTEYGNSPSDLGLIEDYYCFIREQKMIFEEVFNITKNGGYLVVVTNNVYRDGRVWPLAFDTFNSLAEKWVPKDERVWCQDDKALFPFGIFDTYVGNRAHHYCLVFKKETAD